MKKFILIDGNAILHRAYHAYPPLTNNQGMVINGVYGFFAMLFSIIQDQKPEYLAVCFDRPAPTFRQTMFAGYQQGRPTLPDDFVPQILLVHELLETMNVAVFELDGYEADDLLGTIATQAARINTNTTNSKSQISNKKTKKNLKLDIGNLQLEIIIVTGDRDMLQLVNKKVKILMPLVGISKTVLFDEKAVEEKYGVTPAQFIDYKALIGDNSDGYPGVAGIGPKGASNLLREYGTFENLYQNIPNLPEKIALKLATDAEQAALAKKLATIETNVPTQFDIEKCKCTDFDPKSLHAAFVEQGFKNLTARLDTIFGLKSETQPLPTASAGKAGVKEVEKEKAKPAGEQLGLLE